MPLATEKGKEYAIKQLNLRRKKFKNIKKVDNASLRIGASMHYYCESCNAEMKLPENHRCPIPELCTECREMKEKGWLK